MANCLQCLPRPACLERITYEPPHDKTNKMAYAHSEDSDQPGRMVLSWGGSIIFISLRPKSCPLETIFFRNLNGISLDRALDIHHSIILSHVTRKPVFGGCNQVRHKLACTAKEARQRLEISTIKTRGIIPSRQRTTKALIRLRGCAGWSAPLLFAYGKSRFCHDVAHPDMTEIL